MGPAQWADAITHALEGLGEKMTGLRRIKMEPGLSGLSGDGIIARFRRTSGSGIWALLMGVCGGFTWNGRV